MEVLICNATNAAPCFSCYVCSLTSTPAHSFICCEDPESAENCDFSACRMCEALIENSNNDSHSWATTPARTPYTGSCDSPRFPTEIKSKWPTMNSGFKFHLCFSLFPHLIYLLQKRLFFIYYATLCIIVSCNYYVLKTCIRFKFWLNMKSQTISF